MRFPCCQLARRRAIALVSAKPFADRDILAVPVDVHSLIFVTREDTCQPKKETDHTTWQDVFVTDNKCPLLKRVYLRRLAEEVEVSFGLFVGL